MQIGQVITETIEGFLQWLVNSVTGQFLLAIAVVVVGWVCALREIEWSGGLDFSDILTNLFLRLL